MALDAIQDPISLFDPVYQDNGDAIFVMDQVQDKKDTDENWLQEIALKEAIKKLNSREKLVLDLRFYKGRTQIEVADEIGISQAQVSRIEKNALKNMKNSLMIYITYYVRGSFCVRIIISLYSCKNFS